MLSLSPTSIDLGGAQQTQDLPLLNAGGGRMLLGTPTVSTQDGAAWLSAALVGTGDTTRSADALRIGVSRAGLVDGSYAGRVTLPSNGGTVAVDVRMDVGQPAGLPPGVLVYVLAIDSFTGGTVAQVVVDPSVSLDFAFEGLAPGAYVIVAGTDLDDDGYLCDDGEACGAYPVLEQPIPITVTADETRSGLDFDVSSDPTFAVAGPLPPRTPRGPAARLR